MPGCGNGLHVREYGDRYTAHLDLVNPNCDLASHIAADAPIVAGGVALGALIGVALGESPGAMLVGALLGGALGAAVTSASETAKSSSRKPRRA
jgi:hypothetical protein